MKPSRRPTLACLVLALTAIAPPAAADWVVGVFKEVQLRWDADDPLEPAGADGYVSRFGGQIVERNVRLPDAPTDQRDATRIIATIRVRPVYTVNEEGRRRPNDPWTRLGGLSVLVPDDGPGPPTEVEIVRFTTPYGAPAVFEQDVTALAPLLHGMTRMRAFISTYSTIPGWTLSVELRYTSQGVGQRRPAFARPAVRDLHVTARAPKRSGRVTIPSGLDVPRLRVLTTGHATDGLAGNEFTSCTHVLRVDGREVARWRPWSEGGGTLRNQNPTSGRRTIDGRELRSSDLDRTGWHPGLVVEPTVIPLPELTPGPHDIEIEILDIRPLDPPDETGKRHHGYWALSATVVADEPWPEAP
jgi:hypothetical protein